MNSSLIRQSKKDKESNINYKPLYEHMKAMLKANGRNVNYNLRKQRPHGSIDPTSYAIRPNTNNGA